MFSSQASYQPMSEYPTYHTHGRFSAPGKKQNPYSDVSSGAWSCPGVPPRPACAPMPVPVHCLGAPLDASPQYMAALPGTRWGWMSPPLLTEGGVLGEKGVGELIPENFTREKNTNPEVWGG